MLYLLVVDVNIFDVLVGIYIFEWVFEMVNIVLFYIWIVDFWGIVLMDCYESVSVVYDDMGVNVVDYSGFGDSFLRFIVVRLVGVVDQILVFYGNGVMMILLISIMVVGLVCLNDFMFVRIKD